MAEKKIKKLLGNNINLQDFLIKWKNKSFFNVRKNPAPKLLPSSRIWNGF